MNSKIESFRTAFRTAVPVDFIGHADCELLDEKRMVFFDRGTNALLIQKFDHALLFHNSHSINEQAKMDLRKSKGSRRSWNLPVGMAKPERYVRLPGDKMFPLPKRPPINSLPHARARAGSVASGFFYRDARQYGFVEGADFVVVKEILNNPQGGRGFYGFS